MNNIENLKKLLSDNVITQEEYDSLLSKGESITDVMQISGDKNYMSTYRFVKMVPELYPEKVSTIE